MNPGSPEGEKITNGLPVVSQTTRDAFLQELGLDQDETPAPLNQHPTDQLIRDYVDFGSGRTERKQVEKSRVAESFALNILDDIAEVNPEVLKTLRDAVTRGLGMEDFSGMSSARFTEPYARGIGVIFRTFHAESDYRLVPDLVRLTSEDLAEVSSLISDRLLKFGGGFADPFTEALNRPRIPSYQPFLREIVNAPPKLNDVMFDSNYKTGAGVMYEAMGVIWKKLYPAGGSQSSPESQPTPPPTPYSPSA